MEKGSGKIKKNVNRRESNIELFRCVSMILIVAHHYVVNSGLINNDSIIYSNVLSVNSIFLLLFGAWGKTAINGFIFITGYFMCKQNITVRKYLKLVGEILFYRLVFYAIFIITGYSSFSIKGFIKDMLPVWYIGDNFTGCFMMFYLLIPILNVTIKAMSKKQHLYLIMVLLFVYTGLGTITSNVVFNYISWFTVLYFIASYARIYPVEVFENLKFWRISTILVFAVSIISVLVCAIVPIKMGITPMPFYFVSDSNKILAVVLGFCAFMYFKNIKIKYNKFINMIAASTFGVLQIHANSDTMRKFLWKDLFDSVGHYSSNLMPIYAVGVVMLIFSVCTLIDIIRIKVIERPIFTLYDKYIMKSKE